MSGPYKSRLFNFINRQSIHLKDRWAITWGQLRVAAEWGAQLGLYPFYVMVQAVRTAGQQLQQTVVRGQLPAWGTTTAAVAIPCDRPIQNLLDMLQKSGPWQGIATTLEDRALVLVNPDNQLGPALAAAEQQVLHKQIIWEVATYLHDRRSTQAITPSRPSLFPGFEQAPVTLLPGVRFLAQTLRWIQTGPIAKGVDLFAESALPPQTPPPQLHWQNALVRLDHSLALVETQGPRASLKAGLDVSRRQLSALGDRLRQWQPKQWEPTWSEISQQRLTPALNTVTLIQREVNAQLMPHATTALVKLSDQLAKNGVLQVWQQQLKKGLAQLYQQLEQRRPEPTASLDPEADPFGLQKFFWATLDYYFQRATPSTLVTPSGPLALDVHSGQLPNTAQMASSEENPWLDWDDLFGQADVSLPAAESNPFPQSPHNHPSSLRDRFSPSAQPPTDATGAMTTRTPSTLESDPGVIETEVTGTEYVQHPLARVLGWLDQVMLWFEDRLMLLWRWWRDR